MVQALQERDCWLNRLMGSLGDVHRHVTSHLMTMSRKISYFGSLVTIVMTFSFDFD
jgi:hypothetical protein